MPRPPPPQIKHNELPSVKEATPSEKTEALRVNRRTRSFFHSPFFTCGGEEWNSQSSEVGPSSAFQGERATSPSFED
jgi:hypothetical protein